MVLGALIHLGADADEIASGLRGIGHSEFRLRVNAVERLSVTGYSAAIEIIGSKGGGADSYEGHSHTSYSQIKTIIDQADIGVKAKSYTEAAYRAIAHAEAAAHGVNLENVHFHEVGSPRALYTITAVMAAAELIEDKYGIKGFSCGKISDGSGYIECSHGTIPVPVPAVRELLKQTDIPLISDPSVNTEMVTPSGLGVLIGLGCRYEAEPATEKINAAPAAPPQRTGYGFGTRDTGKLGAVRATLSGL
jgi:uncharacterized protein (DUF111 family)